MKSSILFIFIVLSSVLYAETAESLTSITDKSDDAFPVSDTVYWEESHNLSLLPEVPGAESINQRFRSFEPEVTIQRLYRIELPQIYFTDNTADTKKLFVSIINAFGNPGSQVGYTYHSATRDKDIELFEESYISDKRGKRNSGFSFTEWNLPEEYTYYQYIDEANFSGTVFKQNIQTGDQYINYTSSNIERIWFIMIPVIGKDETRNEVLFFVNENYLYIYNCTQVKKEPAVKNLGFPIHLPSMFRKRMDVMVEWIYDQITVEDVF